MHIRNSIISLAASIMAFSAASCIKDDTIRYGNVTMGNIVGGVFVSDQGNIFYVIEQDSPAKLETMERAFTICDILKKKADKEYDVRFRHIEEVLTIETLPSSETTGIEALSDDPLVISDMWISGGYLNMFITVPVEKAGSGELDLTIVYGLPDSEDDTYEFKLFHKASGKVYNGDRENFSLTRKYASFPVSAIIRESDSEFELKWNSYIVEDGKISAGTTSETVKSIYRKDAFEHVLQN